MVTNNYWNGVGQTPKIMKILKNEKVKNYGAFSRSVQRDGGFEAIVFNMTPTREKAP